MGLFNKKHGLAPFMADTEQKTLHQNLEFTATEQYKLLRTNLDFTVPEGTKCPVIGITSATRGEGKSTTAINLAYVLAEKGNRVLLIDGDLRIPSVAKKMNIRIPKEHRKPLISRRSRSPECGSGYKTLRMPYALRRFPVP